MAGKILNVGILGQGRSGYGIHSQWLRQAKRQYKIVAIADEQPERLEQAKQEFGAKVYQDYHKLLREEKLDLVVNALPTPAHPKGTIEALNLGHNVVCEKPMAIKVADFDKMVATAKKNRKLFAPFQNSRFRPYFIKAQQIIASGVIGKVLFARINYSGFARRWDWQTLQKNWGGNLNNTGPHPLDQAVMLFGNGVKQPKVFSKMISGPGTFGDADDLDVVILHGDGCPTVEVMVSSYQAYPSGDTIQISGEYGGITAGDAEVKWKYYNPRKAAKQSLNKSWAINRQYPSEKIDWIEKTWKAPETKIGGFNYMSKMFYSNVYDVLNGKGNLVVTPEQVRTQIYVIEQCHRQNRLPKSK
ncbi:MAG: Gfo/Idh/MocA family oxidoreductase [Planctomycetes bacterium]|nr:Gfo/Idh/MocA family oxidoreductase [Planctomycetota bacterium]